MKIKLFAYDLDGTAIIAHKTMPPENRNAVISAYNKGVICVPCTGRMATFLPKEVSSIPGTEYVISCNGAAVENILTGEIIYKANISNETTLKVLSILKDYDIYIEYYYDGLAVTVEGNPEKAKSSYWNFPEDKYEFVSKKYIYTGDMEKYAIETNLCPDKINLPYLPVEIRQEVKERISKIDGLKLTSSIPDNLEINSSLATKGFGLRALANHFGITAEECMAIGDNGNDADMLKYAGYSVAMANSSEEAFESAKYRTDSCEEFGFRNAIERFILND